MEKAIINPTGSEEVVYRTCKCCESELPENDKYFYPTKMLRYRKDGSSENYFWLNTICRQCLRKKDRDKAALKRMKDHGFADIVEYKKKIQEIKSNCNKDKILMPELSHLSRSLRYTIYKKIKNGYVFSTYEQYKKDGGKPGGKRKYDYSHNGKLTNKEQNGMKRHLLLDSYIASDLLAKSVKELPQEIIETKRLIIQLKRELKNNNPHGKKP